MLRPIKTYVLTPKEYFKCVLARYYRMIRFYNLLKFELNDNSLDDGETVKRIADNLRSLQRDFDMKISPKELNVGTEFFDLSDDDMKSKSLTGVKDFFGDEYPAYHIAVGKDKNNEK